MSDVAPSPDWWMASDGKWYPPESHPLARSAPAQPPVPGWWMASDGNWYPPAPGSSGSSVTTEVTPSSVVADSPATFFPENPPLSVAPWDRTDPSSATAPDPPDFYVTKTASGSASASPSEKPFWRLTEDEDETMPNAAARNWEQKLHQGKRVGVRTVRSAGNYLARSIVMAAIFVTVLVLVLINPDNPFLLIGAPVMLGFRYLFNSAKRNRTGLLTEATRRSQAAGVGGGWASWTSREVKVIRAAAAVALVAFVCGVIGDLILVDDVVLGGGGKSNPIGQIVTSVHNATSTTAPGTPDTSTNGTFPDGTPDPNAPVTTSTTSANNGGTPSLQQLEKSLGGG